MNASKLECQIYLLPDTVSTYLPQPQKGMLLVHLFVFLLVCPFLNNSKSNEQMLLNSVLVMIEI